MSGTYTSENKILDLLFGGTALTQPAAWYAALSTSAIAEAGTGATEPSSANGYARVAVTNNKSNFGTAANGSLTNSTAITFPESTASWGTITHVAFYDQATGGNIWFWEQLSTSKAVAANTTVTFAAGALTISNNNA